MHAEILNALTPVFFGIVLGYLAGKMHAVDNKNVANLNALVMTFAVPAAIFVSIVGTTRAGLRSQIPLALILSSTMLLLYAATYWMARRKFKADTEEASLQALTTSLPNYASAGIPLISALLGPPGLISVSVAIACGSIIVSPITLFLLQDEGEKGAKARSTGKHKSGTASAILHTFAKPIVLAPLVAVALVLCGLTLPVPLTKALALIGEVSGGAGLFLTGIILSAQTMEWNVNVGIQTLLSNVVHPLLVAGLALLFHLSPLITREAIVLAALPAGFFGILLA